MVGNFQGLPTKTNKRALLSPYIWKESLDTIPTRDCNIFSTDLKVLDQIKIAFAHFNLILDRHH